MAAPFNVNLFPAANVLPLPPVPQNPPNDQDFQRAVQYEYENLVREGIGTSVTQ